jgi:hypothetical protein
MFFNPTMKGSVGHRTPEGNAFTGDGERHDERHDAMTALVIGRRARPAACAEGT